MTLDLAEIAAGVAADYATTNIDNAISRLATATTTADLTAAWR